MFLKFINIPLFFIIGLAYAQNIVIEFNLKDDVSLSPISNAKIEIEGVDCKSSYKENGHYQLSCNIDYGEHDLTISHINYSSVHLQVSINQAQNTLHIGTVLMEPNINDIQSEFTLIDNLDVLLNDNENQSTQTLLSSGKDQFWNSVAFQWRGAFFRPRGLDSRENTILINGIKTNSLFNGRFIWGTISGLNAVMRSQETTPYINANAYDFGGLQGTTAFQFNADKLRKGGYVSLANTNSTYQGRLMANYNTGINSKGWAFSGLLSGTYANEGYINGTNFKHLGGLFSIYKTINSNHQLNASVYFTPNERGRSTPLTNEVIRLKGRKYNPLWGFQENTIRNSRTRSISAPTFTINHYWQPNKRVTIQNNFFWQENTTRNSRLEFNGRSLSKDGTTFIGNSQNPDPTYYQRLPSFYLQQGNEDFEKAFLAQQFLENEGQLDWASLYQRNTSLPLSAFIVYSDVNKERTLAINSLGEIALNKKMNFQYKIAYQNFKSENFAEVDDLLGGNGYLDINAFETGNQAQNNLSNPNNVVGVGDLFRYHYQINAHRISAFGQLGYQIKKWKVFGAIEATSITTARTGFFENGSYTGEASLGKSKHFHSLASKIKAGATYNINNKWYAQFMGLWGQNPPAIQNIFTNVRQSNSLVENLANQQQLSLDASLRYQFDKWRFRFSAYQIDQKNDTSVRFFFTENISGLGRVNNSEFVQQVVTGINTKNLGVELGLNYDVTQTLKIDVSAALGKHWYTNNPNLKLVSDSFQEGIDFGDTRLKNYRLANGPQQAYGLGFTYRDPKYWWFNTQLNYFDDSFVSIAEFLRTDSFATDIDGQPILEYSEDRARELLQQEKLPSYFLWNATGGKSWKMKDYYLGFTLGVQNILNTFYRTGGFEQARNGNFRILNNDQKQQFPLFGNRYWVGRGATYYLNMYVRF